MNIGPKRGSKNSSYSKKHGDVVDQLPLKHEEDDVSMKCKRGRPKKVGSQVMVVVEEDNATLNFNAIDGLLLRKDEDDVPLAAAFSLKKKRGRTKKVAAPVTLVEEEQNAPLNSNGIDELPLKHEIACVKKIADLEVNSRIPVVEEEKAAPLTSAHVDVFPLKRKRGRPKKITTGVCVVEEKDCPPSTSNGINELPLKHTSGRVKKVALQVRALEEEEDAPTTSKDIGMPPRKSKRGRPKKIVTQGMEVEEEEEIAHSTSSDTDWRPLKDKRSKKITSQVRVLGEEEDALLKRGRPKTVASEGTVVEEEEYVSSTSSDTDVSCLKKKRGRPKKTLSQFRPQVAVLGEEEAAPSTSSKFVLTTNKIEAQVLMFDCDVESHFEALQSISALSGMDEEENLDASSIDRLNASITFLEVWKDFYYKPKRLKFAYRSTVSEGREILGELELPQFSSASLPVNGGRGDKKCASCSRKDVVLHAGGPVWALDWCPCVHQRVDQPVKCEYLAIAAHPPESSYHKMGAIFSGRGLVQIWCILNFQMEESQLMSMPPKRGRSQANESGSQMCPIDGNSSNPKEMDTLSSAVSEPTGFHDGAHAMGNDFADGNVVAEADFDKIKGDQNMPHKKKRSQVQSERFCKESCFLSEPAALPRLVLGLAHNGRVTWDAKWKPYSAEEPQDKCRMGYLAVLLGNGSLEVWEVPSLSVLKSVYELNHKKGADPRFIKLQPVFKCSQIKRGDHQSVPLTLEWSTAVPHDLILVGFHDGTVALWKFSVNGCTKDRRPLLCFTADNVPIRTLAWAPSERNAESSNIIVTGGHEGLRFWDIRMEGYLGTSSESLPSIYNHTLPNLMKLPICSDPYRPLRDLNRLRKVVLSMDWLYDPGCLLLAFDDGNLRILSISKSANDTPLTGKPCSGTYLQGLHEYCFSTFAIWDVHVSPLTGLVAYCVSDGCTFYFKLPRKAVEKDASRNKAPLFSCGSLTEEESILIITTTPNTPLPMKTQLTEDKSAPKPIQTKRTDAYMSVPESDAKKEKKGKKLPGIVVLPPKLVAMHRVRWNLNKGSERWLSYGGAAGLVRCQEINNQYLKHAK